MKTIIVIAALISAACAASLNTRIIGGKVAEDGKFPYQVSIRYKGSYTCGGAIINEEWILTAAQCILVIGQNPSLLTVVTGTNTLSAGGDIYTISNAIYKFVLYESDIGLIKLATKIAFNDKVQPIALNTEKIPSGSDLLVSGWGITEFPSSAPSNSLQYLELKALETAECQQRFPDLGFDAIHDQQLCAFARNGEGACFGDVGSPLVFNGKLAGIFSWTEPCAIGYPDVYTRVSEDIDWIHETISKN